jgi:glutathionylspermidine amidase/synthetase
LRDHDPEKEYHPLLIQQTLEASGIASKIIIQLEGVAWDKQGTIRDQDGEAVNWVWKTWSRETSLDQICAECEDDPSHAVFESQWALGKPLRLSVEVSI